MSKWKRRALVIAALLVLSYPLAWAIARNSDAYATAEQFLRESSEVRDSIGQVSEVSIAPFGYSLHMGPGGGAAQFELEVRGARGRASAYVELSKRGTWKVREAHLIAPSGSVTNLRT